MSTPMEDLAREAVACPRWRWMPGMIAVERDNTMSGIVVNVRGDRLDVACMLRVEAGESAWHAEDCLPDLSAPATFGCLESLVRGLFEDPFVHLIRFHVSVPDGNGGQQLALWWCLVNYRCEPIMLDGDRAVAGPSRAAALVAVLKRMP